MKKLLISILLIIIIFYISLTVVVNKFSVDITDGDLPNDVYLNSGDPFLLAQSILLEFVNPFSTDDEYTLTEKFMNYMLLDSIRENVNPDYDPLNDSCKEASCDYIVDTGYGLVEYAYVTLNSDNQIVVTVNFKRSTFPKIETAVYALFNVEVSVIDLQVNLELDSIFINETEITRNNLDTLLSYFDKAKIEDMVTIGELNLNNYTYSFSLIGQ